MNVLVLATDVFSKGGVQRYTRYWVKALKESPGIKNVFVFSLLNKNPKNSFEEDILVDYVAGGTNLWQKISFVIKVFIFLKNKKINLIICNHVSLAPVVLLMKKILNVLYIVNVHGLEIWAGLNSFKIAGLKNAEAIVGGCKFILSYIENNLNMTSAKMFLLHNCIDLKRFSALKTQDVIYRKYGIPKGKKIIITVGRLDRDKGQETGIKSLRMLPENVFYVIVGDGAKRAELEKLAENEKVRNRVIFTGRVPEKDLVPLYNIGDVFLLISRFDKGEGEGLGFALIEASACEKPVLGGNEDGSAEAVLNGKSGFSLSPADFSGIIQKLRFLLLNPRRAREMGKEARKYVEKNFSYEVFRQKQVEIIKKLFNHSN